MFLYCVSICVQNSIFNFRKKKQLYVRLFVIVLTLFMKKKCYDNLWFNWIHCHSWKLYNWKWNYINSKFKIIIFYVLSFKYTYSTLLWFLVKLMNKLKNSDSIKFSWCTLNWVYLLGLSLRWTGTHWEGNAPVSGSFVSVPIEGRTYIASLGRPSIVGFHFCLPCRCAPRWLVNTIPRPDYVMHATVCCRPGWPLWIYSQEDH